MATTKPFTGGTDPRVEDQGDGTHVPLVKVTNPSSGGGSGAALSETVWTDSAGVTFVARYDGTTATYALPDGTAYTPVGDIATTAPAGNITSKFREAFETYTPNTGGKWVESKAMGDLVYVDGNAAAASYLVISKDPLTAGGVTEVETVAHFGMPIEMSIGMSMSQRTLGQEFAVEVVSDDEVAPVADIAIASISQTVSVLTIDTAGPHGLVPGKRIGINGVSDSRLNYPALVVASIPSPTQITVTAGPSGNLPAVTAGPFVGGTIFFRSALGFAQNGTSMILEQTNAPFASFYVRSESGDALPSGTAAGSHSVAISTTNGTQAVAAANTRAFQAATEYKLALMADRLQWSDAPVDTVAASTNRHTRSQVVPNPSASYKLRFRATNNDSMTLPVAQIVSAVKTGTTTATLNFDRPHGLTIADQVNIYGVRDQVNFANAGGATAVASVVSPTAITVAFGANATATSYGGYVAKMNGGVAVASMGQANVAVQAASVVGGVLTLTGNVNWSGVTFGDLVNAIGVRADLTGTSLGVDGAYRVRNIATTTLELERIDGGAMPADFAVTNCGGSVIKRTDLRVSFVRIFDFERERVEIMARPAGDIAGAIPVAVQNVAPVSISGNPVLGAGVNAIGTVGVTSAGTPAAPTSYFLNSAAGTNLGSIVAGTTGVQSLYASNIGASVAFVKLYNKATAPTAADVPVMVIPVPAAVGGVPGVAQVQPGFNGLRFALGLGIAVTGGMADNDATAVTLGQVKVNISRTA